MIAGLMWSWKRMVGIAAAKAKMARKTGLPMSKEGVERKIGGKVLKVVTFWRK